MSSNAAITSIPCADSNFRELCSAHARMLPSCTGVRPKEVMYSQWYKILRGKADCADIFELKDELLESGLFKFKVISWCMFPAFKKGDILKILPASGKTIEVGDVPVYRKRGRLYAHRAVGKEYIDGKINIITRPDTTPRTGSAGTGERVAEEEILGVVREIKRWGRILAVKERPATALEVFLNKNRIVCSRLTALLKKVAECACIKFQTNSLYRLIGKSLVIAAGPYLNFILAVPFSDKFSQVYIHIPLRDGEEAAFSRIRESRISHLLLKLGGIGIGYLNFLKRPDKCPYPGFGIGDIYIRLRYRGLGFDSLLLKKAEAILKDIKARFSCP